LAVSTTEPTAENPSTLMMYIPEEFFLQSKDTSWGQNHKVATLCIIVPKKALLHRVLAPCFTYIVNILCCFWIQCKLLPWADYITFLSRDRLVLH